MSTWKLFVAWFILFMSYMVLSPGLEPAFLRLSAELGVVAGLFAAGRKF